MVSITDLTFRFGARTLYDGVSLHIKPRERIGLIGANGTGKSTLLRLITGEYTPDSGTVSMARDCTIGFLNQDLLSYQTDDSIRKVAMQAFERTLQVQQQLEAALHELETEYSDELVERVGALQEEFERLEGYSIEARTDEVLEGLGFTTADLERPLRTFSGGWRMRVMLAKLLLQNPSLLLLDEPTNHLDLPSIQWIEEYLQEYEGAIITVSHDREFINRLSNIIVEVTGGRLDYYAGNYDFYLEEKALRQEIQRGAYENQQAAIRQTERFINTFRAKASKARQVQSRVKALERMDRVEEVEEDVARVHFRFTFGQPSGRHVLQLKDVAKSFGGNRVLERTGATLERGQKVGLVGANGRGKTTLLRIIAGLEPIEGTRELGHNVRMSFFAQHQLEALGLDNTILDELKQCGSRRSETELRTLLGCFLFSEDDVFKKIKVLSGGEKSRVALAKTLISEANVLLLDEPTNHLDIQSVNILIQALQQYEGTVVVVSHDRHFVSQVASTVWFIEDRELKSYPGTWNEYLTWMDTRRPHTHAPQTGKSVAAPAKAPVMEAPKAAAPKVEPKSAPVPVMAGGGSKPRLTYKQEQELARLEADIERLEQEKATLVADLADPALYRQPDRFRQAQTRLSDLDRTLEDKTRAWEGLVG